MDEKGKCLKRNFIKGFEIKLNINLNLLEFKPSQAKFFGKVL